MEGKLFALLTKHVNISESSDDSCFCKFYIMELATAIDIFAKPNVHKVDFAGYSGGLYRGYEPNTQLLTQIDSLLPSSQDGIYLSDEDASAIEKLFEERIQMKRVFHADNNPRTKGYGFRIEYSFYSIEDTSRSAEEMLQYIIKVLTNGELKKALEEKRIIEEAKERERVAKEKEEEEEKKRKEAEQKRIYDDERRPGYLAMLKRSESIVVPKKKKDAITVNYEDFEALIYSIRAFSFDEYPSDEARCLRHYFAERPSIKVWLPNTILHCMDRDQEYTMKKTGWCIAMKPVKKTTTE